MSKKTKFIHVDDDGYTVGYCKPPKATQFRKGVSPNPKGRKRNIEFFKWEDPVFEVLFEDLTLPMKGKPVTLPSIVWMLRSMRNNAVKGCHRSFKFLIDANGDRGLKGLWYALKDKCRERTEAEIEASPPLAERRHSNGGRLASACGKNRPKRRRLTTDLKDSRVSIFRLRGGG